IPATLTRTATRRTRTTITRTGTATRTTRGTTTTRTIRATRTRAALITIRRRRTTQQPRTTRTPAGITTRIKGGSIAHIRARAGCPSERRRPRLPSRSRPTVLPRQYPLPELGFFIADLGGGTAVASSCQDLMILADVPRQGNLLQAIRFRSPPHSSLTTSQL